jgi:hypothetical protein
MALAITKECGGKEEKEGQKEKQRKKEDRGMETS